MRGASGSGEPTPRQLAYLDRLARGADYTDGVAAVAAHFGCSHSKAQSRRMDFAGVSETIDWLRERQPPLDHVALARKRVADLEGRCAVSFSGGKDSTVLVDLAAREWDTGLVVCGAADGETVELCDTFETRAPHLRFDVWLTSDLTGAEQRARTRDALAGIDNVLLGLRAEESPARAQLPAAGYRSAERYGEHWCVLPILTWTSAQVADYIHKRQLPHHSVYDRDGWQARNPHPAR